MDTPPPELPVTMADIEKLEKWEDKPGYLDNAENLRGHLTSEFCCASEKLDIVTTCLQELIEDDRMPDDLRRDAQTHLNDLRDISTRIKAKAGEEFESHDMEEIFKKLVARSSQRDQLMSLAQDQQHALERWRERIDNLEDQAEFFKSKADRLEGQVKQLKTKVDALGPLVDDL